MPIAGDGHSQILCNPFNPSTPIHISIYIYIYIYIYLNDEGLVGRLFDSIFKHDFEQKIWSVRCLLVFVCVLNLTGCCAKNRPKKKCQNPVSNYIGKRHLLYLNQRWTTQRTVR